MAGIRVEHAGDVTADLHGSRNGGRIGQVQSLQPLLPGNYLHFKAVTNIGGPFDSGIYELMWRIKNTDEAAAQAGELRGRFEKPESDNSRWESLKYRGVHLVEAFALRRRDDKIVGRSTPFRVMIE